MLKREIMLERLKEKPMTISELAESMGDCKVRINSIVAKYRHLFRIDGWTKNSYRVVRVWGAADGTPDKPRPIRSASPSKSEPATPWDAFIS